MSVEPRRNDLNQHGSPELAPYNCFNGSGEINNINHLQMDFIETLKRLTESARNVTLMEIVSMSITFWQNHENILLPDLLRALGNYTMQEHNYDPDANVAWAVVGKLLTSAADKVEAIYNTEEEKRDFRRITPELLFINSLAESYRRLYLLRMVSWWTGALEQERGRFSGVLAALSQYTEAEGKRSADKQQSWAVVSSLLNLSAEEAAKQGRQL